MACIGVLSVLPRNGCAWEGTGHQLTGMLASRLLVGSRTERELQRILGDVTLVDAAVWADCAKGIDPAKDFHYTAYGAYPECARFESREEVAHMRDFVRRAQSFCREPVSKVICHKRYHYTDVALHHRHYDLRWVGTRSDDVVGVTVAAIRYLRGEVSRLPVSFESRREALFVLVHSIGDLHQPLHVASVYLNTAGDIIDPDAPSSSTETGNTAGGNRLVLPSANQSLHHLWDSVPRAWLSAVGRAKWLSAARKVAVSRGRLESWPALWADGTLASGRHAFKNLRFERRTENTWRVALPPGYTVRLQHQQRVRLIEAAARLAAVLQAIWP